MQIAGYATAALSAALCAFSMNEADDVVEMQTSLVQLQAQGYIDDLRERMEQNSRPRRGMS